jgi:hypothetical protein
MRCLLVLSLAVLAFTSSLAQSYTSDDLNKFAWLKGTWTRVNSKAGRTETEQWSPSLNGGWSATSVTIEHGDTVFIEKVEILVQSNQLYYVADVPENSNPVYFKIIELTEAGFVCENNSHDFPKKIQYRLEGKDRLNAQISGNGKIIEYLFQRMY